MPERVTWRLYWATPLVGALGGWLASLVGWPLPWMIGSLLAVMLVRCLADLPLAEDEVGVTDDGVAGARIGEHRNPLAGVRTVGGVGRRATLPRAVETLAWVGRLPFTRETSALLLMFTASGLT